MVVDTVHEYSMLYWLAATASSLTKYPSIVAQQAKNCLHYGYSADILSGYIALQLRFVNEHSHGINKKLDMTVEQWLRLLKA